MVVTWPGKVTLFPPTPITVAPGETTTSACQTGGGGAVTTPTPIAANMAPGCTKFYQAQDGDGCWAVEQKYGLTAAQFEAMNPDVGTGCTGGLWLGYYYCVGNGASSGTTTCLGGGMYTFPGGAISPVFHTTSHVITIQPQATVSVTTPTPPGRIRYSTTKSSGPLPTNEHTDPKDPKCENNCGDWDCGPFGCPPGIKWPKPGGGGGSECGLFGCDGGCGILGCGGLCGFFGCGCKGCTIKPGGGGGGNGPLPPDGDPQGCDKPKKPVVMCEVYVNIWVPDGKTTKTTSSRTMCITSTVCDGKDSTTTTTISSSQTTSTMTFTMPDPPPRTADPAAESSMAARIESLASKWDAIFTSPTGGSPTGPPTVTGLCSMTLTVLPTSVKSYCDCGTSFASTMPLITSTDAPCAYTTLPHICRYGASPQQGREYCNCEDYPHTLPVLPTSDSPCAYTSFPDPWPYTYTDSPGNVIACETSSVHDSKTDCSGDSYTVTPAPPKPTAKPRCITAHTFMNNCLLSGDSMSVQLWDSGKQVCAGGKSIAFASDQSTFDIDCGGGASVSVTDNGSKLTYKAADGWQSEIARTDRATNVNVCGYIEGASGNTKEIKGFQFENVFANDMCGGCNTAKLCDMNSKCDGFDGKCS